MGTKNYWLPFYCRVTGGICPSSRASFHPLSPSRFASCRRTSDRISTPHNSKHIAAVFPLCVFVDSSRVKLVFIAHLGTLRAPIRRRGVTGRASTRNHLGSAFNERESEEIRPRRAFTVTRYIQRCIPDRCTDATYIIVVHCRRNEFAISRMRSYRRTASITFFRCANSARSRALRADRYRPSIVFEPFNYRGYRNCRIDLIYGQVRYAIIRIRAETLRTLSALLFHYIRSTCYRNIAYHFIIVRSPFPKKLRLSRASRLI